LTCAIVGFATGALGAIQHFWRKGTTNRADYFSKHHPTSHHQAMRSIYLYSPTNPSKNYFGSFADTDLSSAAAAPTANSLTLLFLSS
jgi:hypothetical protein